MHVFERLKNKAVALILAVAVALSMFSGFALLFRGFARADEEVQDIKEFEPTSLNIGNANFDSSSGSYPASPSSWTGDYVGDGSGNLVKGVVDLADSSYFGSSTGNKAYKLDVYPEYADERSKPKTIFGADSVYANTDTKALLINTVKSSATDKGAETAYAYTSSDLTFVKNSFYRVSAWVKTGNFAAQTGATVKLTGLGQNCSFININTVKNIETENGIPKLTKENNYGWVKYTFYVRTSAAIDKTVKLSLGIGDALSEDELDKDPPAVLPRKATGYAFFDTVEAERISAHDYANETEWFTPTATDNVYTNEFGTAMALDLYETELMTYTDKETDTTYEVGSFSENTDKWQRNIPYDEDSDDTGYAGNAQCIIYDSESRITKLDSDDNIYGFTQNPWAPLGRAEYSSIDNDRLAGTNGNIMLISTYNGKKFNNAAFGVSSPAVTVKRYGYYRFGVWVKTDKVDGGSGATISIKGKMSDAAGYRRLTEYTTLQGDSADKAHYGWKEQIVYIKGSALFDYDIRFELWLGTPDSQSSGIAMFDNVTFTELKYSEYSDMAAGDGGNVYSIDGDPEDTGVTNGNFALIGDFDELTYPLPAAEWLQYTAETVDAHGFSTAEVDTKNIKYGVIPTDAATFSTISAKYLPGITNPANWYSGLKCALLLSSSTPTAFCMQSQPITLSTDKANKLNISMAVNGVTDGNGAALVLKTNGGDVISSIENIKNTGGFRTYTFYLAAPLSDKTVSVEIWLGLNDRYDNTKKLSNGNVYVREVALEEWKAENDGSVADEFNAKVEEYKSKVSNRSKLQNLDFGVYSFSTLTLDYYDVYDYADTNELGVPYGWEISSDNANSVKYGMFNTDFMKDLTVYNGFESKDISGNMLYVFHTENNRSTYSCDNTLSLVSNLYYRLDVTLKVRLTDEALNNKKAVGASIKLTGAATDSFDNIKDTTTLIDKSNPDSRDLETFKTYSFYISTGENGGDLGLAISFGGEDKANFIQGKLVIGNVTLTEIDNTTYEEAEKSSDKNVKAVKLSEANKDDEETAKEATSDSIQWWIIPTIIFSSVLIIAIIIIFVVRLIDRIKKKRKPVYENEYDRNDVMRDIERLKAEQEADNAKANAAEETEGPDEFDDSIPPRKEQPEEPEKVIEKPKKPEPKKPEPEDLDD